MNWEDLYLIDNVGDLYNNFCQLLSTVFDKKFPICTKHINKLDNEKPHIDYTFVWEVLMKKNTIEITLRTEDKNVTWFLHRVSH